MMSTAPVFSMRDVSFTTLGLLITVMQRSLSLAWQLSRACGLSQHAADLTSGIVVTGRVCTCGDAATISDSESDSKIKCSRLLTTMCCCRESHG
jgi:hypothetical protein